MSEQSCGICGGSTTCDEDDKDPLCYWCGVCETTRLVMGASATPRYYVLKMKETHVN